MPARRQPEMRRIRVGQRYREAEAPTVVWEVVGVTGPKVVPHAYISQAPEGQPRRVQLVSWESLRNRHLFEPAERRNNSRTHTRH